MDTQFFAGLRLRMMLESKPEGTARATYWVVRISHWASELALGTGPNLESAITAAFQEAQQHSMAKTKPRREALKSLFVTAGYNMLAWSQSLAASAGVSPQATAESLPKPPGG